MTEEGAKPQAWIIVATRENMEKVAKHHTFGRTGAGPLAQMRTGDHVVAYIRGEKTFSGVGTVTQEHYQDDTELFGGGLYPDRVGVDIVLLPRERAKDVWGMVESLQFPSNKFNWWASLVGGVRKIPVQDFEFVKAALR